MGILEGEGGGGAVLPRLGAEVVVEAGAGGHGLGVEVGGEGAILKKRTRTSEQCRLQHASMAPANASQLPPPSTATGLQH